MNDFEYQRSHRAAPVCSAIALAAPFEGFVCGVIAGISAPHFRWLDWGFGVWLGFGIVGLVCGVLALVRAERLPGIMVAGLILNTLLVWMLLGGGNV